jgi:hypothetical protein
MTAAVGSKCETGLKWLFAVARLGISKEIFSANTNWVLFYTETSGELV